MIKEQVFENALCFFEPSLFRHPVFGYTKQLELTKSGAQSARFLFIR